MCLEGFDDDNYLKQELCTYVSDIFQAAGNYHVMMSEVFINDDSYDFDNVETPNLKSVDLTCGV